MAKDPAFLFYSKDFYEGTRLMLPEERACYVDLLIYQHQHEFIPNDHKRILMYCNGVKEATLKATLKAKFILCDEGWYNLKLQTIIDERKIFSSKQSINGKVGQFFKKAKHELTRDNFNKIRNWLTEFNNDQKLEIINKFEAENEAMLKAMLKHLEDVNAIEDVNNTLIEKVDWVINYLNKIAGTKYALNTKATRQLIEARINDGRIGADFKHVIDVKCKEWLNTDMAKFLRPDTLFNVNKFEVYLQQKMDIPVKITAGGHVAGETINN